MEIHALRLSDNGRDSSGYNKVKYHPIRYDPNKEGDRERALKEIEQYISPEERSDWLIIEGKSLKVRSYVKIE